MAADYKTLLGLVREFVVDAMARGIENRPTQDLMERATEAIKPSEPKNDQEILHIVASEHADRATCCSRYIVRAARKGTLDLVIKWECPICGTEWKASLASDGTRHWTPEEAVAIFRR